MYTRYIGVYRVYSITGVFMVHRIIHGYTGYIGVYRLYSTTRVNMGTQDILGYTRVYLLCWYYNLLH